MPKIKAKVEHFGVSFSDLPVAVEFTDPAFSAEVERTSGWTPTELAVLLTEYRVPGKNYSFS